MALEKNNPRTLKHHHPRKKYKREIRIEWLHHVCMNFDGHGLTSKNISQCLSLVNFHLFCKIKWNCLELSGGASWDIFHSFISFSVVMASTTELGKFSWTSQFYFLVFSRRKKKFEATTTKTFFFLYACLSQRSFDDNFP